MKRPKLCCLAVMCLLALTACGPSDDKLSALGRSQQIEENAPLKAASESVIHAPIERVWNLLADVSDWPRWQHDISQASSDGPLRSGAIFTWQAGDTSISSRVVLFKPPQALAWTGNASIAKALHVWTLTSLGPTMTRVTCRESMDGFLLARFYSSAGLQASIDHWIADLKAAAEANPSLSLVSVAGKTDSKPQ